MSDPPIEHPDSENLQDPREHRLLQIRREAEQKGGIKATGVRLPGAPFPSASAETGYYGIPLLKQPAWTWEIPLYFFVGGAAGAAAVVGAMARWTGRDPNLARDCRYVAAAGTALSSVLLIGDLGRPARFLAMLRVFKRHSPMSVGAWTLAVFGSASAAAALAELAKRRFNFSLIRITGNVAEGISALGGLLFSNYTGVLIGATVIPVWNENVRTLPVHFGMSGLNSAASILELMGHENSALNNLAIGASAIETLEGFHIETTQKPSMEPLKRGSSGLVTRLGGVLSGPIPVALRLTALFTGKRRARHLRRMAAAASVAGSILTRFAWVQAGHTSAKDWRLPLRIDQPQKVFSLPADL